MRIKNAYSFPTATTFGVRPPDQRFLTVVIKGTFALRDAVGGARPLADQLPILQTDQPYDLEKPEGLVRFEHDLAPFKPRADVVLVGHAYPLGGRPASACDVEIAVGRTRKVLRVVGDRRWSCPAPSATPQPVGPLPFEAMPLTYDRAFGGSDVHTQVTSLINPGGRGLIGAKTVASIHGTYLPNIEDPACMIERWDSHPLPVGCGFFPRGNEPRCRHLGTYDERWQATRAPLPPDDFRFDFFNAAHPDLQVQNYLIGNERVRLAHVVPGGRRLEFSLPCIRPLVSLTGNEAAFAGERQRTRRQLTVRLDTLVFVPDQQLFYVLWRAVFPLARPEAIEAIDEICIDYEQLSPESSPSAQAGAAR